MLENIITHDDDYEEYKVSYYRDNVNQNDKCNTVSSALGLSNISEKPSFNSIKCWITDLEDHEDVVDQSFVMQRRIEEGTQQLPTFKYLHQDLFLSLRKYRPEILPEHKTHISTRMNRDILEKIVNTPEFIRLRRSCRMDNFLAAIGTEVLSDKSIDIIREIMERTPNAQQQQQALKELMEQEEQIEQLYQSNEDLMEEINALMQGHSSSSAATSNQVRQLQQQVSANQLSIEAAQQLANSIAEQQKCQDLLKPKKQVMNEVIRALGKAMDAASLEVQEMSELCQAWGFDDGQTCCIPFENKRHALEAIRRSSKLKRMTNAIGRFKDCAVNVQKRKSKDGAVELSSVTVGDKIQDVLPSELMTLTHPTTKRSFYRKMTDKQLMVYAKEAHKQKSKGPIIVCVDTSGSMLGNAEIWSKAITIGMLEIAEMQKRDFACILYSGSARAPIILKKGEKDPEKVIKIAETFFGGGTNFESPLEKAMKLMEESVFSKGDIVFITDGECDVSDNFLKHYQKVKDKKEFSTLGILINLGKYGYTDVTLRKFCDDVVCISKVVELKDSNSDVNKAIFGAV